MTSDDQHFLDVLAGISRDIRNFTGNLADASDRHFEHVALAIKEALASASWIPEAARPSRPPARAIIRPPLGYVERVQRWISRNQALTAAVVAFLATGGLLVYRRHKGCGRKRRARRASNGARKEVTVVAGPASSPITKSIALDLERKGFIVYVTVNTAEEEHVVRNEGRVDIRPLHLDIVDPLSSQQAMERFNNLLLSPHQAFVGASPHNLRFAGLVVVPDLIYPTGPVETVSTELWSDALNAKVLHTIAVVQAFLPTVGEFQGRVLLLTPSIVWSLRPAFHGVESAVVGALEGFAGALRGELATLGIAVCQLRLGTFDLSTTAGARQQLAPHGAQKTWAWGRTARTLYATNYVTQSRGLLSDGAAKGSSLRELHHAVFDALTLPHPPPVWRVGRGSVAYDMAGRWLPDGLVAWMLGLRRVRLDEVAEPQLQDSVQASSWERVDAAAVAAVAGDATRSS